jgi:4-diphosphocytidyl-2C-methyl-D-erythritol kinase
VRAVALLAATTGEDARVAVSITKGIPVAGGCAGGSADAAAALVGADALWGTALSKEELTDLAAQLGSDVPFALHGGTALGTGRGEQLTEVLERGTYSWVLAVSEGGLSTPAVYAELDRQREAGQVAVETSPDAVLSALRQGDAVALGRALGNDLQPAALALRPTLRPVLEAARSLGALGAVVSGSGPTVAVLARDDAHAGALAAALTSSEPASTSAAPADPSAARASWRPADGRQPRQPRERHRRARHPAAHGRRLARRLRGRPHRIVGRNGGGKTTLLRTLVKAEEPHSGRVTHTSGLRVGVLTQDVRVDVGLTAHQAILGETAEHTWAGDARVREVLDGLGPARHRPRQRHRHHVRRRAPARGARPRCWCRSGTCSCSTSRRTTSTSRASPGSPPT